MDLRRMLAIRTLLLLSFVAAPSSLYCLTTTSEFVGGRETRSLLGISSSTTTVNVKDFGAEGDGTSDDTEAFMAAWKAACSSSSAVTLLVPESREGYLLKPVAFAGPCRSHVTLTIRGTAAASPEMSDWDGTGGKHWILFDGVENLRVGGGGTFDGNGQSWWKSSCKVDKSRACEAAPTAVTFFSCTNLEVDNLGFKDSQGMHVSFDRCARVRASNLRITAPSTSPNTDGIHVTGTTDVHIDHCAIHTGDDCISIVSGSRFVTATNVVCGPGHGISVGSLGAAGSLGTVSDVLVDVAEIIGADNGVRIKTWQGGRGYARNITFRSVTMKNTKNPILIDQNYCDSSKSCSQKKSAVAISGVTYENITGTSASVVAVKFDCSRFVPCDDVRLQDIRLQSAASGGAAKSVFKNVKWSASGTVIPLPPDQVISA